MFEPDFTRPSCSSAAEQYEEEDYDDQLDDQQEEDEFLIDDNNNDQRQPDNPLIPNRKPWVAKRVYTTADLNPTVKDARCDSNWMLANLWPVYVGNFRVASPSQRDNQIREYFASKGLLVRWWFNQEDEYYFKNQIKAGLYDMLVYFVSEKDAELAIEHCHRDTFDGYKLNVFPGRKPSYFPKDRSIFYMKMKSGHVYSEEFFERRVVRYGAVNCVVKFDEKTGAAEFVDPADKANVSVRERLWNPLPVPDNLKKQRFLECDLMNTIAAYLQSKPGELKEKENHKFTLMLLSGTIPVLNPNRPAHVAPIRRGPSKDYQMRQKAIKMKKNREYIQSCLSRGQEPGIASRFKTKAGKKNYKKMVNQIKQQMGM